MKSLKTLNTVLFISVLLVGLSGCQKPEGPAEKAGKSLDNATEQLGEKVEDAGDAIQDAAQGDK